MFALHELVDWVAVLDHQEPECERIKNVVVTHGAKGSITNKHNVREDGAWVSVANEPYRESKEPVRVALVATLSPQQDVSKAIEADHKR